MEVIAPVERTLTEIDHARLTRLQARHGGGMLHDLLDASELAASPAVPADVVTMYTQLLLEDGADAAPRKLTLCYPDDAEPAEGFISVLSPVGAALLGLRTGQLARWRSPSGQEGSGRILAVLFQPEASGDYTT